MGITIVTSLALGTRWRLGNAAGWWPGPPLSCFRVTLGPMEYVLHRPHHSNVLDTHSLVHLREFLARGGVTPSLYEAKDADAG